MKTHKCVFLTFTTIFFFSLFSCKKQEFEWSGEKYIICKVKYPTEYTRDGDDWVYTAGEGKTFVEVQYHKIYEGNQDFLFRQKSPPYIYDRIRKQYKLKYSKAILNTKETTLTLGKPNNSITYSMFFDPIWKKNKPYELKIDGKTIKL